MALGRERADRFHRVHADGTLGSAMVRAVAMGIAVEAVVCDVGGIDRSLRDAAGRDADLHDATGGAHARALRRIIRWIVSSSTTSSRWFSTR